MSERLLVVSPNWAGDALFSTPALRALRKKYPQSRITCLAPARVKGILANNPHVNEVIVYDDRAPLAAFWRWAPLIARLQKMKFDTAVLLHNSATKAWLASSARIRERIGFEIPSKKRDLTLSVQLPERPLHRIDHYLYLLEKAGIPADGRQMEYVPAPEAEASLKKMLPPGPYVVVHAGGNWELKRWPAEFFAEWIRLWRKDNKQRIVLCGTRSETTLTEKIASGFSKDEVLSLCGKTSFDELAFLLRGADLLLSNDSGPIHLAATQGTRILGLYGPTSPRLTGPVSRSPMTLAWKDVGCEVPCYFRACHHRACMEELRPGEIVEEAKRLAGA